MRYSFEHQAHSVAYDETSKVTMLVKNFEPLENSNSCYAAYPLCCTPYNYSGRSLSCYEVMGSHITTDILYQIHAGAL